MRDEGVGAKRATGLCCWRCSQRSGDSIACVDPDSARWTRDEGRLFQHERWNCPERATHNTILSLQVARVGMPLGNGKASVLDEQTRLGKYTMIQEDGAPLLSVEDVLGS